MIKRTCLIGVRVARSPGASAAAGANIATSTIRAQAPRPAGNPVTRTPNDRSPSTLLDDRQAGKPLSRTAGEGAERSEAGEGVCRKHHPHPPLASRAVPPLPRCGRGLALCFLARRARLYWLQ